MLKCSLSLCSQFWDFLRWWKLLLYEKRMATGLSLYIQYTHMCVYICIHIHKHTHFFSCELMKCILTFQWKQRGNVSLKVFNKTVDFSWCYTPHGNDTVCAYKAQHGRDNFLQHHPNNSSTRTLEIKRKTPQQNKTKSSTMKIQDYY